MVGSKCLVFIGRRLVASCSSAAGLPPDNVVPQPDMYIIYVKFLNQISDDLVTLQ